VSALLEDLGRLLADVRAFARRRRKVRAPIKQRVASAVEDCEASVRRGARCVRAPARVG